MSARDAARSIIDWRRKTAAAESKEPAVSATEATPEPAQESAAEADAAPPIEEDPGATEAQPEPEAEELPPIEPPRSWTKDEKAEFATYPREVQERIARREQDRERVFRQSQNEVAEQRKAIEADRGKVDQARQQYESALPILLQNLQSSMAGEFSDIQSMADVQKMANDDWPRYVRWDAQQKQVAAVQQELNAAQYRQAQERQKQLSEFMKRESELFAERVPEIADEAQRTKLQNAAVSVLKELGFQESELVQMWRGEKDLSIHDHRVQLLIRDGIKYRESQVAAKAVRAAPKPQVQRPGVAKPKGAAADERIQALSKQIDSLSGDRAARAAAQLLMERRKAAG